MLEKPGRSFHIPTLNFDQKANGCTPLLTIFLLCIHIMQKCAFYNPVNIHGEIVHSFLDILFRNCKENRNTSFLS